MVILSVSSIAGSSAMKLNLQSNGVFDLLTDGVTPSFPLMEPDAICQHLSEQLLCMRPKAALKNCLVIVVDFAVFGQCVEEGSQSLVQAFLCLFC